MEYFVTAIGTDSGKTLVSAILTEFLKADYWKPIQSGFPRDTETVSELISNTKTVFHEESYLLKTPASPHASAKIDNVKISLENIQLPQNRSNDLVIEGAGGVLVPLNENDYVIDISRQFSCKIILVSNLYLGSINHTLLTIDYLKKYNLPVQGIIFNGEPNQESESIILNKSGYKCLLRIPRLVKVDKGTVKKYAEKLSENWL